MPSMPGQNRWIHRGVWYLHDLTQSWFAAVLLVVSTQSKVSALYLKVQSYQYIRQIVALLKCAFYSKFRAALFNISFKIPMVHRRQT